MDRNCIVVMADMIFYMAADVSRMVFIQQETTVLVLQLSKFDPIRIPVKAEIVSISRTVHFSDLRGQAVDCHFQ